MAHSYLVRYAATATALEALKPLNAFNMPDPDLWCQAILLEQHTKVLHIQMKIRYFFFTKTQEQRLRDKTIPTTFQTEAKSCNFILHLKELLSMNLQIDLLVSIFIGVWLLDDQSSLPDSK